MKYIIGIILGALLILNWSSVKTYIEQKLDSNEVAQQEKSQDKEDVKQNEQAESQQEGSSEEKSATSKADSFSEFK